MAATTTPLFGWAFPASGSWRSIRRKPQVEAGEGIARPGLIPGAGLVGSVRGTQLRGSSNSKVRLATEHFEGDHPLAQRRPGDSSWRQENSVARLNPHNRLGAFPPQSARRFRSPGWNSRTTVPGRPSGGAGLLSSWLRAAPEAAPLLVQVG